MWAHARGPVRSVGVRRCGASLTCLCARLSASRGSERPACEAFPAALCATHSVEGRECEGGELREGGDSGLLARDEAAA